MPDSLKVHSGERVDLVDYVQGANTYTQEAEKFEMERAWLDRRSRILDGFRVQIEDQTVNPGMITVYNGNAVDRSGQIMNNEQTVNDSRSITLLGASLNFYVEIEFIQNESSTDARFFWDPTIPNTVPEPDGSEFSLNVATRLTPDWRIVNPVSTTSFEQTSNPNSIRVPVGVFRTDGSNRIVVGGTNPGLTLVRATSVLEVDSAIGANQIRVVDNRVMPATLPFNVTVDFGGTAPEARTVSSIDRANGLLTLSVALASTHKAGAIVRVTSGTAMLVKERTDPSDPALDPLLATPGHPDPAQRLWQANETRGSALTSSKETFGARDDLNIRTLKDQIDALSAQIRELKFGSPRPDVVAAAPPLTFGTRPRWFDKAGGVQGARTNSVSIGNGTTSFGDFNLTGYADASALLTAAIAALPAAGGTIYVKAGTYSFPTTVTNAKIISFIGESFVNTVFTSTNAGGAAIATSGAVSFTNMTIQRGGGAAVNVLDITAAINCTLNTSLLVGQIRLVNVSANVTAVYSALFGSGSNAIIAGTTTSSTLTNARFSKCAVSASGFFITTPVNDVVVTECSGSCLSVYALTDGSVSRLSIDNNQFTVASVVSIAATVTGTVSNVTAHHNRFTLPAVTGNTYAFGFWNTAADTDAVHITDNYFNYTGGTTAAGFAHILLWLKSTQDATDVVVDNNVIDCNVGSFIVGAQLDQRTLSKSSWTRNYCNRMQEMVRVGGPIAGMISCDMDISGNVFAEQAEHANVYGIRLLSDPGINRLTIRDNMFTNLGDSSGVGIRVAVELTTASSGLFGGKYDVSNNTCFSINAGDDESSFLRFVPASSNQQDQFVVADNFVEGVGSPTVATGIYFNPGGTNIANIKIRGNRVDSIGDSGTTASAFGIFVSNQNDITTQAPSVTITENDVFGVRALPAGMATGIEVQNCGPCHIRHNTVSGIECAFGTILQSGAGIRFQNSTTNAKGVMIADNIIDQAIATVAASAFHSIVVATPAVGLNGYMIDRNHCRSSASGVGNEIAIDGSGGLVDGSVSDNVIVWRKTVATVSAISIQLGNGSLATKVHGNVIQETTYGANMITHIGISVFAQVAEARGVSICNNILTGAKTGALLANNPNRIGIRIRGAISSTICSNNLVDWNAAGVIEGRGIVYKDDLVGGTWDQHVIVGNLVTGDNSALSGGELDFDTVNYRYGYVVGNSVGGGAAVGTMVPAIGAIGATTWDYGTGAGAGTYSGLNKLT